ncbi:TPA: alpha/beta hydrolase [Streptococcus suis]|uniref:serine aminopeptidase domain-containing protein n=1 Tax=Streptococcus TaxID=1301 RepID=UPI001EDCC9EE|nr:alpha/beta hydrolase [Streptococcus suis]
MEIGAALIDKELARDNRPIFLYGLSAGGMETYHVAVRNPEVRGIIGMTFLEQKSQLVRDKATSHILTGRIGVPAITLGKAIGLGSTQLPMTLVSKMSALVNDKELLAIFLQDKTSAGNLASINFLQSYMNYVPKISPQDFDIAPILLTQPDADKWTPYELSRPVLDHISKAPVEVVHLPNGSHYPVENEALRVMNDSIDRFIKAHL